MIPEEVIAELKRRVDLATVIGRTVKLKRVGRNMIGLCPFHKEKSPSFNVHVDEGYFYCFGCRATGDVVTFLERTTGQSFRDVVVGLAADAGIEIPEDDVSPEERARRAERARLGRVLDLTQMFFRQRLIGPEGKVAKAYLYDVRKLADDEIDRFGLGYGGTGDPPLAAFLKENGVDTDDAIKVGVLGKTDDRPPYDFFRFRITFPIRTAKGEIAAFGGRIFGEQQEGRPKYVNSKESSVYDKSRVLYGLYEALPALKQGRPAVLVEGYLDVIAMHKAGLPAAVAPCGTSLTPLHVEEIKKRTAKVALAMDSDAAGQAGADRALLMLLGADLDVSLVVLTEKDPDDMVRAGQGERLKTIVDGAPSALDALVAKAREEGAGSVRARIAAVDKLLPFLAAPGRDLVKNEFVKAAALALGEDQRVLQAEVDRRGKKLLGERVRPARAVPPQPGAAPQRQAQTPRDPRDAGPGDDEGRAPRRPAKKRAAFTTAEKSLARDLMLYPELAPRCGVLVEVLRNDELRGWIERLTDALVRRHDEDPRKVVVTVGVPRNSELAGVAAEIQSRGGFADPKRIASEESALRDIEGMILTVDKRLLEQRLREVQPAVAAADERKDHGAYKALLDEQRTLIRALQELDGRVPEPASEKAAPGAHPPLPARAVVPAVVDALRLLPPLPEQGPEDLRPHDGAADAHEDDHRRPAVQTADHGPGLSVPDAPWEDDPEDDPWG